MPAAPAGRRPGSPSLRPSTILGSNGGEVHLTREQRKLAAILAADVVGYSRLMGRDGSGTLARLQVVLTKPWPVAYC